MCHASSSSFPAAVCSGQEQLFDGLRIQEMQLLWKGKISASWRLSHKKSLLMLRLTFVRGVTLCSVHKEAAEKFGFRNIMRNVVFHKYPALLLCCTSGNVISAPRYCWGGATRVTVSERVRQRWEGEREKQIERLPTGDTRGISVKSTLEEDGLK